MLSFRLLQALSVSSVFGMWLVKTLTHPKLHLTMLVMAVVVFVVSEAGYRAGKHEAQKARRKA